VAPGAWAAKLEQSAGEVVAEAPAVLLAGGQAHLEAAAAAAALVAAHWAVAAWEACGARGSGHDKWMVQVAGWHLHVHDACSCSTEPARLHTSASAVAWALGMAVPGAGAPAAEAAACAAGWS
jgi:hypothetical protein